MLDHHEIPAISFIRAFTQMVLIKKINATGMQSKKSRYYYDCNANMEYEKTGIENHTFIYRA